MIGIKQKVYLIGDCHSTRIYEHHDFNNPYIDLKMWGKAGMSSWVFDPELLKSKKRFSSKIEHDAHLFPEPISFDQINDDGLILAWFGYLDVKYLLYKGNSIDETAYKYISRLKNNFPNSKIKLIEPHPQFVETMLLEGETHPNLSYKIRQEQNKLFCEALEKYSKEFNLEPIIKQEDIYSATGLKIFTAKETVRFEEDKRLLDGLAPEFRIGIYNLFIKEIYKSLDITVD